MSFPTNGDGGVLLSGGDTALNVVEGNYISLAPHGLAALGNTGFSVSFALGAHDNTIGGLREELANVISGNVGSGVLFSWAGAANNHVVGNVIGLDSGGFVLGNSGAGVEAIENASGNPIGGEEAGTSNQIVGNGGAAFPSAMGLRACESPATRSTGIWVGHLHVRQRQSCY
ncbi:MAG: hypothetical protein QGG73_09785 [Candidatus Hydrogenedentes bacterium]|jgi:hypothetical protein|nr:hypothetical protein [Candidatus Hydrogenedentota bacterium]